MKIRILSSAAERAAHNRLVDGSNPSGSTGIAFRIVYRIISLIREYIEPLSVVKDWLCILCTCAARKNARLCDVLPL